MKALDFLDINFFSSNSLTEKFSVISTQNKVKKNIAGKWKFGRLLSFSWWLLSIWLLVQLVCPFHSRIRLQNRWWKFHNGIVCVILSMISIWWDDAETIVCPCYVARLKNKLITPMKKKKIHQMPLIHAISHWFFLDFCFEKFRFNLR